LTIYNDFHADVDNKFHAYIPIRMYEVTLKHRLLDQLGDFSHLLLDALSLLPESGITWVMNTTGLNLKQLEPILDRLYGLGLLNGSQLSQRGEKLATWKRLLQGQIRHIWLDGSHMHHSFCGDASLKVTALQADNAFIIRRWHRGEGKPRSWSCKDWNEDCERQKNRILRYPEQYLQAIFNNFRDCFIKEGFNAHEWELEVRYVPEEAGQYLPVILDKSDLESGVEFEYSIATPVLCLETFYRVPIGAPKALNHHQPDDHRRAVSLGYDANIEMNQLHDTPPSSWVWPEVGEEKRQQIIDFLFQQIEIQDGTNEAFYNREHRLADRWQLVGFDWPIVERRLQANNGLHRIRSGA